MSLYDKDESLPQRRPTAIERDALDWVARLDRGMTLDEQVEFDRWLAADVRHAAMFVEFDGTWAFLDRVREIPEAVPTGSGGEIDPEALAFSSRVEASVAREAGAGCQCGAATPDSVLRHPCRS